LRTFNGIKIGARAFTIQEGDNVIVLKQTYSHLILQYIDAIR